VRLSYRTLFALAAPLRDPATAPVGTGQIAFLGGLNAADTSTDEIALIDAQKVVYSGALPNAQHDAQAAELGGKVYVFGGGDTTELDHILRFDPVSHAVQAVGTLPTAASDVAVTQLGDTAYVVGGYNGVEYENTILAYRAGSQPRVVGHLPVGLRYSAVTSIGDEVIIIGGSTPAAASRAIFSFTPSTGALKQIGQLPHPITHGNAAALDGYVYLIGGRGDLLDAQTRSVWSIDPSTGAVKPAGQLPQPLSDAGVMTLGQGIVVAGGFNGQNTVANVGELVPAG
jgi:N-acetylneuraminic acid mutarotase